MCSRKYFLMMGGNVTLPMPNPIMMSSEKPKNGAGDELTARAISPTAASALAIASNASKLTRRMAAAVRNPVRAKPRVGNMANNPVDAASKATSSRTRSRTGEIPDTASRRENADSTMPARAIRPRPAKLL